MIRTYGMTSHEVAKEVARLESIIKHYKEAMEQLTIVVQQCERCAEILKELNNDTHND
jgi:hypothetical protein